MSDLHAFLALVEEKISESAKKIMHKAEGRRTRYASLLDPVAKKWGRNLNKKSFVQFEADQIKAIVSFEVRRNKKDKNWNFETEGIHSLTDDFFLLNEYLAFFQGRRFLNLVRRWGAFVITPEEQRKIEEKNSQQERDQTLHEIVEPRLRPVWSFLWRYATSYNKAIIT